MFVDKVQVKVQAGDGGNGVVSFRHEKFREMGGPDGGDGGNGGNVILQASRNENTLADFRYQKQLHAQNGEAGSKAKRHGKSGQDLIVNVPVGTVVFNSEGQALADLDTDGQQAVIAKGGKGGFGNAHFVSSRRQAPRVAEKGEKGDQLDLVFELKMIADVGLVGLPNAGKSTLLSVVSNAHPEIANYPFTTLQPNLGVVDIDKKHSLLFADIPGLIEGASQGKGLGDEFLRHVERTSVLVHLIDAYQEDVESAYKTIMKELKDYKVDLSRRPQIVALSKTEGLDAEIIADIESKLKPLLPKNTLLTAVSAQSGDGLKPLLREVLKIVQRTQKAAKAKAKKTKKPPVITLKENPDHWFVEQNGKAYIVKGNKIERFADRTHFGNEAAEQRLRDIMRKMGIMRELRRRGVEPGDTVTIGSPPRGSIEY